MDTLPNIWGLYPSEETDKNQVKKKKYDRLSDSARCQQVNKTGGVTV